MRSSSLTGDSAAGALWGCSASNPKAIFPALKEQNQAINISWSARIQMPCSFTVQQIMASCVASGQSEVLHGLFQRVRALAQSLHFHSEQSLCGRAFDLQPNDRPQIHKLNVHVQKRVKKRRRENYRVLSGELQLNSVFYWFITPWWLSSQFITWRF